jgi:hypothetical protein
MTNVPNAEGERAGRILSDHWNRYPNGPAIASRNAARILARRRSLLSLSILPL